MVWTWHSLATAPACVIVRNADDQGDASLLLVIVPHYHLVAVGRCALATYLDMVTFHELDELVDLGDEVVEAKLRVFHCQAPGSLHRYGGANQRVCPSRLLPRLLRTGPRC